MMKEANFTLEQYEKDEYLYMKYCVLFYSIRLKW